MKVLLPEGRELQGFERQLQRTLEQANLEGYALMGFSFCEAHGSQQHEIDALVLMKSGIFVCLEAKGYAGRWTGSANEQWMCNDHFYDRKIKSVNGNPYKQVSEYSLVIKDRLKQQVFKDVEFFVNAFVVAPDRAEIAVVNAVVDQFQLGNSIFICHCSRLEQVLSSIWTTKKTQGAVTLVQEIGLERIISKLTGVSVDQIEDLVVNQGSKSVNPGARVINVPVDQTKNLVVNKGSKPKILVHKDTKLIESVRTPTQGKPSHKAFKPIAIGLCISGFFAVGFILAITAGFFGRDRPCEVSTETRISNICYKDLTRTPLRVGILTAPAQYTELQSYLEKQLGSKALNVTIEGNSDISYTQAQNRIAKQEWDVVFALSPMNGMRAKDNGYTWVARMFPDASPVYQSALFVRANSSIQSINDIVSSTMIALGDLNSVSSFYMPAYDLYGKSASVTVGHRSSKIKDLVASKQADVGTAVYSSIKDDPNFRVIHVSRELPGAGVYLSPKLSPTDQKYINQLLMNAPEEIKKQANYGVGTEPNYEVFRAISVRADEVMACANFKHDPVQFFCNEPRQGIVGKVSGFTNQTGEIVRLRLEQEHGKLCDVIVPLQMLSGIPDGSSPGVLNGKRINIVDVQQQGSNEATCELTVTNPKQLVVLQK